MIKITGTEQIPAYSEAEYHHTCYLGTRDELIRAKIVPPDFFNFKGPHRSCSRGWYGKKIPTKYTFPKNVICISVDKKGSLWSAEVRHKLFSPPYIPPGERWPVPETKEEPEEWLRLQAEDKEEHEGRITTGVCEQISGNGFTITFIGTKEKLIACGLAKPNMFPEGKTPTGKERREKQSGKTDSVRWLVSRSWDNQKIWHVHYYDTLNHKNAMLEIRQKYAQAMMKGIARGILRKPGEDENENGVD